MSLPQQAADAGYAPAIYALANWYIHGKIGGKKDFKKALLLLKRAAQKGMRPPSTI